MTIVVTTVTRVNSKISNFNTMHTKVYLFSDKNTTSALDKGVYIIHTEESKT